MDLLIYVTVCLVFGIYHVVKNGSLSDEVIKEVITAEGDNVVEIVPGKELPIGDNYENYYDPDAFMYIVHELGLG